MMMGLLLKLFVYQISRDVLQNDTIAIEGIYSLYIVWYTVCIIYTIGI